MSEISQTPPLQFGLPKGRIQNNIIELLREAGITLSNSTRGYRPKLEGVRFNTKILKPQNIVKMLDSGSRDLGFAGRDWVEELEADVVEVLDTGLDPVKIVCAAPDDLLIDGSLPSRKIRVASEYQRISERWLEEKGLTADLIRTYGATEVFPPEDADCIIDNTATGSTLSANKLTIVDTICRSSTCLFASEAAMEDEAKREQIDSFAMVIRSVLEGRSRALIEVNVAKEEMESLIAVIPCMKEPTIAALYGGEAYSIKAAVPRGDLATLIPLIKARGGSDIVVVAPSQIVA